MSNQDEWTGVKTRLSNMFLMGGIWLPNPSIDSATQTIATFVNSGRNTEGQVIGQKIGRDQSKLELKWQYLTNYQWSTLLKYWDKNFFFRLEYFDMRDNQRITKEFYVSDRQARPLKVDLNGAPVGYIDCSVSFVETGR